MSNMLKSFGIVLGLSILLFLILKLAGLPNADNAKLALTPFTIIAFVYSKLEEIDKAKHSDDKLQSLNDFSLPSWKAYLLGTITGLALLELTSGLAGVLGGLVGAMHKVSVANAFEIIIFATAPLTFFVMFATGRWIGIRAAHRPILIAIFAGASCRLLDFAIGMILPGANIREAFKESFTPTLRQTLVAWTIGCILFAGL